MTLTLSGFDTTLLPLALAEFQAGTPVIVYLGLFSGGVLIANPATAWSGRMDRSQVDIDGATSSISINCESRLLNMKVSVDRRYTPDDQQRDWPGDSGLSFVNSIQEMTLYWGSAPTTQGNV